MTQLIASYELAIGCESTATLFPICPVRRAYFCLEKMMILVLSATYLCRRGHIDGCIYGAISIFGFFEVLLEITLIASLLGK